MIRKTGNRRYLAAVRIEVDATAPQEFPYLIEAVVEFSGEGAGSSLNVDAWDAEVEFQVITTRTGRHELTDLPLVDRRLLRDAVLRSARGELEAQLQGGR